MTTKIVMIGMMIMITTLAVPNVAYASVQQDLSEEERESGFYDEEGYPLNTQDRPVVNPAFDPDEDCNLAYELKCLPGAEQECPDGFHNGEDNVCSPIECQEGYITADDDETGLCITPEECEEYNPGNYVLIETDDGTETCAALYYICDNEEHIEEEYCVEWSNSRGEEA
jgi:hypothetical protein